MAAESPIGFRLQQQRLEGNRVPRSTSGGGGNVGEIEQVEEFQGGGASSYSDGSQRGSLCIDVGEKIFVAVGKQFKESKSTLIWALQNGPRDKKFVLVHVHRPAQMIPVLGGKFPASQLTKQQVHAHRLLDRGKMIGTLEEYLLLCTNAKVQAETLVIDMDDVAKGILTLIAQHGITKLVMGAASDGQYSKKMKSPKSKTSCIVQKEALPSCNIWFVCKGNLICTRTADLDDGKLQSPLSCPSCRSIQSEPIRKASSQGTQSCVVGETFMHRSRSDNYDLRTREISMALPQEKPIRLIPHSFLSSQVTNMDLWEGISRRSSQSSDQSSSSTSGELGSLVSLSVPKYEDSECGLGMLPSLLESEEDFQSSSPQDEQEDGIIQDDIYNRLQQAFEEANRSKHEAYKESCRRQKAERDAIEAVRKAKVAENMYARESKQRKDVEEILEKKKLELEKLKHEQGEVLEELRKAHEQKSVLESQVFDADHVVKDLEEKLSAAQLLVSSLQTERDELQQERDDAIREAELQQKNGDVNAGTHGTQSFSEFTYLELEQATDKFDDSLKIGEGGYGSVYKGVLRQTPVAIKKLHPQGMQGQIEFHQEVEVLSRVRHPNLVTLIGACTEAWCLIYEFLPNGSLEDRLLCKDNSPPLPWQVRICIATEICSALIFLHSNKLQSVVHGDLKPANILLDANCISKLSDFGISRLLIQTNTTTSLYRRTDPKGTFAYMDPEFIATGELRPGSDIYSFGIIILRLLTGRPAMGIVKEVQDALTRGTLHMILDRSAGDWPFVLAKRLAHLGLRCSELNWRNRPDLVNDIWGVLQPMKKATLTGRSRSCALTLDDDSHAPPYFFCPIFQEIMRDPRVAADGFTYEAQAVRAWFECHNNTSPMTNLTIQNSELIPNNALRSAIQEWLQKRQS